MTESESEANWRSGELRWLGDKISRSLRALSSRASGLRSSLGSEPIIVGLRQVASIKEVGGISNGTTARADSSYRFSHGNLSPSSLASRCSASRRQVAFSALLLLRRPFVFFRSVRPSLNGTLLPMEAL